uniref:Uncharacterized protein n=1 Tax=Lactuca sativa TaxID=4236 RepID=A0A9R1V6L9_LACSA|nr:hypothetical protein LSAT_V11C600331160 [Lactuca sativa]
MIGSEYYEVRVVYKFVCTQYQNHVVLVTVEFLHFLFVCCLFVRSKLYFSCLVLMEVKLTVFIQHILYICDNTVLFILFKLTIWVCVPYLKKNVFH